MLPLDSSLKALLSEKTKGDKLIFHNEQNLPSALEEFKECEIVFGNPPLEWLKDAPNLKWVQLGSAGLDPYQEIIREGKIQFSNVKGFYDAPVAETAIGGLLMLQRKLHILHLAQQEHLWIKPKVRLKTEILSGKKVLILGMGSIGKTIKRCLKPFEVSFLGNKDFPRKYDLDTIKGVEQEIEKCDILIACLPELPSTVHFLNRERLELLKPTSLVINVGRGSLIDENALTDLLQQNRIAGAFLDVTEEEPIRENSHLWDIPNLLLNQHTGGSTKNEYKKQMEFIAENYLEYKKGKPENIVSA